MAPLGMVDMLGGFSSLEVGIISLVVFLILSITLTALCARCSKKTTNAYDVNGTTQTDGGMGTNAGVKTSGVADPGSDPYGNWKGHSLPPPTLERKARTSVSNQP